MHILIRRPTIPKQRPHNEQSRRQRHPNRQPILRHRLTVLLNLLLDNNVRQDPKRNCARQHSNTGREIRQTDGTSAKAVLLREYKGEGAEHEVQHAVDDGDVEGEDEDGEMGEEHSHWADGGVAEALLGCEAVFVEDGIQVLVAGFFLELGGFGAEERWGVGLWGGEVT